MGVDTSFRGFQGESSSLSVLDLLKEDTKF